ncbi:18746_t:CDS:2 [Dentiscutata erythropus]|uniref:18746_t:CDS:1 n=1 Tax=Dentiscutata erythropus TaxID=1348616 RepID=A0A9N9AXE5_9GLOM|nr:18746_t:CDS:2 [Dentiscutata erythropus]
MSNKLYDQILQINTNEYLENESAKIDFKCDISLDENEDDSQKLSKVIAESLGNADERFGVNEIIKEEIKKNLHLNPSEIYQILECNHPNLTQKQVHAWCIQRQESYPFVDLLYESISNSFLKENSFENLPYNSEIESLQLQLFSKYKSTLQDALEIVQEQENSDNIQWAQAVWKSFEGIENLVREVKSYKNRTTNPRTWKNHNRHTMYLK